MQLEAIPSCAIAVTWEKRPTPISSEPPFTELERSTKIKISLRQCHPIQLLFRNPTHRTTQNLNPMSENVAQTLLKSQQVPWHCPGEVSWCQSYSPPWAGRCRMSQWKHPCAVVCFLSDSWKLNLCIPCVRRLGTVYLWTVILIFYRDLWQGLCLHLGAARKSVRVTVH